MKAIALTPPPTTPLVHLYARGVSLARNELMLRLGIAYPYEPGDPAYNAESAARYAEAAERTIAADPMLTAVFAGLDDLEQGLRVAGQSTAEQPHRRMLERLDKHTQVDDDVGSDLEELGIDMLANLAEHLHDLEPEHDGDVDALRFLANRAVDLALLSRESDA
jgi:hypothetical protein